ncbi:MAG: hypothetical protein ACE363_13535 [Alphaproteobacteria bacterium]
MASPYVTGGGGAYFEAKVAASYLVAVLCEAHAHGLPGQRATKVLTQQGELGEPLDDIVVEGVLADGTTSKLSLQITNSLSFTQNDEKWTDVVGRAWDTFSQDQFDGACHRIGVGIGVYSAKADKHIQSVLKWARTSADAEAFFDRITKPDFSHTDKSAFVADVRHILKERLGAVPEDEELWKLLKSFVVLHFDFQSDDASRDSALVIDRLAAQLAPENKANAGQLWETLVNYAADIIPTAGGADRAALVARANEAGIAVAPLASYASAIESIDRESALALDDIRSDIGGIHIHRSDAYEATRSALQDSRFVQVTGEPGCGKSAVLKEIAEECAQHGPVFALKDLRIRPGGWPTHASALDISCSIGDLLREFACCGEPILFIDGIDKITDAAAQLTVNDILRAIVADDSLSQWRVLSTVRENNLQHLETWLDGDALGALKLRTISVTSFSKDELTALAEAFPRFRPLFVEGASFDAILTRPFFLDALVRMSGDASAETIPTTEVELLKLWWRLGGTEASDEEAAQARRNALLELAERAVRSPGGAISIRNIPENALTALASGGVIQNVELGHTATFSHDIYEEWALCELLVGCRDRLDAFLSEVGEPQILARPVQLLATYELEGDGGADAWSALLSKVSNDNLRPLWRRCVITAPVHSVRSTALLEGLTDVLTDDDFSNLKSLITGMRTVEVVPNPVFLDESILPDLPMEDRITMANYAALPKLFIWVRFLDWLVPKIPELPHELIPEILPVLEVWQKNFAGYGVRHTGEIGKLAYEWLVEIESCRHVNRFEDLRPPFGLDIRYDDEEKLEKRLRVLLLSSARTVPNLIEGYLTEKARDEKVHIYREHILENCMELVRHTPSALVDFMFDVLLEDPELDEERTYDSMRTQLIEEHGIADHHAFYPPSPVRFPFLALLRLHEEEALRLIRGLCNHAVRVWKYEQERHWDGPKVTLIPIELELPWGQQRFWGDGRVYLWFRGTWGNNAINSALMALEQWALEEIEGDRDFEDVFQKVVEGNEAVSVLGIGVSLALAHPGTALERVLPLVTCPHLWDWDIQRCFDDQTQQANEMGDWHRYGEYLKAVRALNQKPHRKHDIRALVPYFVFQSEEDLRERYVALIQSFPERLPYLCKEQRESDDLEDELRNRMSRFVEHADPQYWKVRQSADGEHIEFYNEAPSLESQETIEQQEQYAQLSQHVGLALAADKAIETGQLQEGSALREAIAQARSLDEEDLFELGDGADPHVERNRLSAVAGTAFLAARFYEGDDWESDIAPWCYDVLKRASVYVERENTSLYRGTLLMMYPPVYAAYGFAALLARGYRNDDCREALLNLAVDALEGVVKVAFASSGFYAQHDPDFVWFLFCFGCQRLVGDRDDGPDYHSPFWDEAEARQELARLEQAGDLLTAGAFPDLPSIPAPWIKGPAVSCDDEWKGYVRNNQMFNWHLAKLILLRVSLDPILENQERRDTLLKLVEELLDWAIEKIVPPFADGRRHVGGDVPYEWIFEFSAWCGGLAAKLSADEVRRVFLQRILDADTRAALVIMPRFMRGYMIAAILYSDDLENETVSLWEELADWVLSNPELAAYPDDHLDGDLMESALALLFCVRADFQPLLCGVDPGWPHLSKFDGLLEKVVKQVGKNSTLYHGVTVLLKRGGTDLLPSPGLDWLLYLAEAKRSDRDFWTGSDNGEDTVQILRTLLSDKASSLTDVHRQQITRISDILVDNGVRGAGFLQQELVRGGAS